MEAVILMDCRKVYSRIVSGTKEYFKKSGFKKAVVGLSGGVDSSLTACILVDALGSENVNALLMPDSSVDNSQHHSDALDLAKNLGIECTEIPVDALVKAVEKSLEWKQSRLASMNLRARIRMLLLYSFANSFNALVVGTSNKSELTLGYFTKHGDGATDVIPLGSLYKTEVFELAGFRGLPQRIIEKKPSAGLYAGQTDESELGAPYPEIDRVLAAIEKGRGMKQLKKEFQPKLVDSLLKRIKDSGHKRQTAFVVRP